MSSAAPAYARLRAKLEESKVKERVTRVTRGGKPSVGPPLALSLFAGPVMTLYGEQGGLTFR